MTETADGKARIVRLGQILRIFMEKEKVSSTWLSRQFQTTPRTIQRDLLLLKKSGFPLHEIRKGIYQLHKDLVRNLEVFDDTELALVVALKNIVGQLCKPFQTAADNILDHLYDCVKSMPVFVKIDDAVPLDSSLLSRILQAILKKRTVSFRYAAPHSSHPVVLEPYRVVYFSGFWYLIGNEPSTGILKRYALDKIENFKSSRQCFTAIPSDLDDVLRQSANIWFTEDANIEITVHIDARVSDYFKRRKMFPTQEIKEERPDGSLVMTFRVGNYEAIRSTIKSWLPYMVILEPEEFRESLLNDMKEWIKKQEKTITTV